MKDQETLEKQYFDSHVFDCHIIDMFWLLSLLILFEFIFVFAPSNVIWTSINKINLKPIDILDSKKITYVDDVIASNKVCLQRH